MNLESLFNFPIQALQEFVFTPVLMLALVFAFIFLLVLYHWSGLSEKVENLTTGKKFIVFAFITAILIAFYYIFYKAGKFDKLLSVPIVNDIGNKIINLIN